ncbi:hypothetical protein Ddye_026953 [Dipteronia dyeriana]|uniref:Uncharacterized protein n=1 Tax=Dipteronia dyeriana TaxID=168575 RepID=A0AAD9TNZ3_9ROSI|nr:hypothetical protein Ddye_026953 [Dipteronia dyeriana]
MANSSNNPEVPYLLFQFAKVINPDLLDYGDSRLEIGVQNFEVRTRYKGSSTLPNAARMKGCAFLMKIYILIMIPCISLFISARLS